MHYRRKEQKNILGPTFLERNTKAVNWLSIAPKLWLLRHFNVHEKKPTKNFIFECKIKQIRKKVQVAKDQEKAQSEKDSHSKNRDGEKTKLTLRYLYHENIS